MSKQREAIIGFTGPMNARKTLMLLDHIFATEALKRSVNVYKPVFDDRFGVDEIRSRGGGIHEAIPVPCVNKDGSPKSNSRFILDDVFDSGKQKPSLVAIDEVQFFDEEIKDIVLYLAEHGVEVAFAGLNRDFKGDAFPAMKELMPIATQLDVLTARCTHTNGNGHCCGAPATMTQRLINGEPAHYDSPLVIIEKQGTQVAYEARCLEHWKVPGIEVRQPILLIPKKEIIRQ
jgi:thymidine kinase